MTISAAEIVDGLTRLIGSASVMAEAPQMADFLNEPRKRFHQAAVAVALPKSVAEVQSLARWANANRVPLIPQGGNTGLVGAQVPLSGREVVVSLRWLNAIREIDAAAGHMTVEAGLTLEEAHRAAEAAGAMFPLWIASPAVALELFYAARARLGSRLTAFELVPKLGLDMQLRHQMLDRDPGAGPSPWYVLIEVNRPKGGTAGALQALLEVARRDRLVADAVMAESADERTRMWTFREQMSACQSREGASIKHDVSVPIAAVPRLIEEGSVAVEKLRPGIRPCPFGHLGDGNIHFNFSQPVGADPKAFMAGEEPVHDAIYEVVLRLGGSISAEHGIGQLKTDLLKQVKDPVALEVMRSIKQALDPNGILNPGKLLG